MNLKRFIQNCFITRLYAVADDKNTPPGGVYSGFTGSGMTSNGRAATPFKNFLLSKNMPFKTASVSPPHKAQTIFTRESPLGDYQGLNIGSECEQYIATSAAIADFIKWKKTSATQWLPNYNIGLITDPGDAAAIPVTKDGLVRIVTAAGETRTLAAPAYPNQVIALNMVTDVGDCVVTVASAIDQNGSTVVVLNDVGDYVVLQAFYSTGTTLAWRIVAIDGALVGSATYKGKLVADPADAGAISVTQSGVCELVSAGAETRTLAIPTFAGQELTLVMNTDAGDIVTTVAAAIDLIGHTTITHNAVGQTITLVGVYVSGALVWRVKHLDGVLLGSTAGFGNVIADVGTGVAIPVTHMHVGMPITTAAAETNTLAIPTMIGQTLSLWVDTYAVGDRVITAASAINAANNTIMTFGVVSDAIELKAVSVGGALAWQVVANDGVALS